ncbi:MAG TPA: PAS domain S-box protein [Stellaceae bacterium]|nr:PAS domain S-box protein [Stellaceae bacterium]
MDELAPDVSDGEGPQHGQLQFRLLVDSVRDCAIYLLDTAGFVKSWNLGAERIKGYAAPEILGRHFSVFYTDRDRAAGEPVRALAAAASAGRYVTEAIRIRKDGSPFWADVVITAVRDEGGTLLGFAKITRDITERRQSDEQSALLTGIFDYNPDGVAIIDADGRIVKANDQLARLFGYEREALLGAAIEILLPERFRNNHVRRRGAFFASPRAREMGTGLELYGRRADGSEFPVDVLIGPIRGGIETLGIAIVRDATARREAAAAAAEDQRRRATLEERARAAEAMRETSETLSTVIEASPLAVFAIDRDENVSIWNPAAEKIYGWAAADVLGLPWQRIADATAVRDTSRPSSMLDRARKEGGFHNVEIRRLRRDGTKMDLNISAAVLRDSAGGENGVLFIADDITRRNQAEEQLRQAQKMEVVGQLTGGMAHDFNNLLSVVIGNLDLLRPWIGQDGESRELLDDALAAAMRGAELTRRLLAFSRRQPMTPQHVSLNERVSDMVKLLERTLGENIEISLDLAADLWPVVVDPAQLEASLINLATNARDAMASGGRLMVAAANRTLDADYVAAHPDAAAGDYAVLQMSDTGSGMTPEVLRRIFEPFFTTKAPGRGTGLGLSMVFGFMKQSGGHINVYSEPGGGTTFRLYLPRAVDVRDDARAPPPAAALRGNGETVLAVEDNESLRRLVVRQIRDLGYRAIEASSAEAALAILAKEPVDLLFTDIVMPGTMDGFGLAHRVCALWPSVRLVLTSGFPEVKLTENRGALPQSVRLLIKPYRREELAQVLRQVLGA